MSLAPLRSDVRQVNGFNMHYLSAGHVGKPLLVLLHGFPDMCYIWKPHVCALAEHFFVVAPDQRGINKSGVPGEPDPFALDKLASDVFALADGFGYHNFTLVGHDWGGVIAWRCANNVSERIDLLVIVNSPHPALLQEEIQRSDEQRLASAYIERIRGAQGDLYAEYRPLLEAHLAHGFFDQQMRNAYVIAYTQTDTLKNFQAWYRAAPFDVESDISSGQHHLAWDQIRCNTHVLWGEADRVLLPSLHQKLETYVKHLRKQVYADVGHNIHLDNPQLLVDCLLAYHPDNGVEL